LLPQALPHSKSGSRTQVRSPGFSFAKLPDSGAITPLGRWLLRLSSGCLPDRRVVVLITPDGEFFFAPASLAALNAKVYNTI